MAVTPPSSLTWLPVPALDGVWHAERVVNGVPLRSLVVRLADGRVAVHSPIRGLGRRAHDALAAIGAPAFLIAPNHFHNLGLREYAAAYPGASVIASPTAAPRVARRCGHEVHTPALLGAALPAGMSLLEPPGTRAGELWLSFESPAGRAWSAGDAFFNIARTPRTPMGLLLRLLGISAGLRIGASFRWLVRDRPGYRRWLLDAIAAQRPTTLIPCHGEILADPELPQRLRRLVEQRV
jgi:hypothetical protein